MALHKFCIFMFIIFKCLFFAVHRLVTSTYLQCWAQRIRIFDSVPPSCFLFCFILFCFVKLKQCRIWSENEAFISCGSIGIHIAQFSSENNEMQMQVTSWLELSEMSTGCECWLASICRHATVFRLTSFQIYAPHEALPYKTRALEKVFHTFFFIFLRQ